MMECGSHVGERLILWRWEPRERVVKDTLGRPHDALVVVEEIPVTVTEERQIKRSPQGNAFTVLTAAAEDGRSFFRDGQGHWSCTTSGDHCIIDAVAEWNNPEFGPFATPDGDLAVPNADNLCARHQKVWMDGDPIGCRECHHDSRARELDIVETFDAKPY